MEFSKIKNGSTTKNILMAAVGGAMLLGGSTAFAAKPVSGPVAKGNCAALPATRADQFHGNPAENNLSLAMAGNQWVVFAEVLQKFNEEVLGNDPTQPAHDGTDTKASLNDEANSYYIELIPPGKERAQIESGCMTLGNENEHNFLPFSVQTNFDLFASTNYGLMQNLAADGYVSSAQNYVKNKLDLLLSDGGVPTANPKSIGVGSNEIERVVDMALDLLDPSIRVSEVDHVDEGIHKGINKMYQAMDRYVRLNGTSGDVVLLDTRLASVATPQAGSPSATRTDTKHLGHIAAGNEVDLWNNPACHVGAYGDSGSHLQMCEFAILNKANTHETRVHHVETPALVRAGSGGTWQGTQGVDTGPLWVSEVQFAMNAPENAAQPVVGAGVPSDSSVKLNGWVIYSLAHLATQNPNHATMAQQFYDWIRIEGGTAQTIYEDGGFGHMSAADLAGGQDYDCNGDGAADAVVDGLAVPQTC